MEENLKIEILFPEFCNLYGDISNMKYLKKCLPNANFVETSFDKEPCFVKEKVNFIYLGPMTEKMQEKVITKLKPYKTRIEELIEKNVIFLITGNAIEIFGKYIENEDESKIEALGIFDIYAKRDMLHRHNSIFIGKDILKNANAIFSMSLLLIKRIILNKNNIIIKMKKEILLWI